MQNVKVILDGPSSKKREDQMDTDYSGSCFIFLLAVFGACFHEFASMLMIPFSDSKFRFYWPLMKPLFLNSFQLIKPSQVGIA